MATCSGQKDFSSHFQNKEPTEKEDPDQVECRTVDNSLKIWQL